MFLLQKMVVYPHPLSFIDHTALDLPAIPWARIFLARPHNRVEVTSLYWPLTITPHDLQLVALFPYNYRMAQKIRHLCLTNFQIHPSPFTIRQKSMGTIDWTLFFVRGSKTTPIHPETSVTKRIILDLSLGYVPCCCYGVTCLIFLA